MAEVHTTITAAPHIVGSVHNPDNGNGSNSKIEGTSADKVVAAKTISVGGSILTTWKNPA